MTGDGSGGAAGTPNLADLAADLLDLAPAAPPVAPTPLKAEAESRLGPPPPEAQTDVGPIPVPSVPSLPPLPELPPLADARPTLASAGPAGASAPPPPSEPAPIAATVPPAATTRPDRPSRPPSLTARSPSAPTPTRAPSGRASRPPTPTPVAGPPPPPSRAGLRIGPYVVLRSAERERDLDAYVAEKRASFGPMKSALVKHAPAGASDYAIRRQMLLDEARALARIDHVNLVNVLDADEDDDGFYLALEHVDGVSLARVNAALRKRGEALPFELACFMAAEVLRGLHHAHGAVGADGRPLEIVHRDVSPTNVLISTSGHIKLDDFGVVRMRDRVQDQTEPGFVKGTIAYLAPEYVRGESYDHRVDVYAVGVMLFEMLTGRPCFSKLGPEEIMRRIVEGRLPMERLEREGVPPELRRVVERATDLDAAQRFGAAEEMANALETWILRSKSQASPWILSAFFRQHGLFDGTHGPAPVAAPPRTPPPDAATAIRAAAAAPPTPPAIPPPAPPPIPPMPEPPTLPAPPFEPVVATSRPPSERPTPRPPSSSVAVKPEPEPTTERSRPKVDDRPLSKKLPPMPRAPTPQVLGGKGAGGAAAPPPPIPKPPPLPKRPPVPASSGDLAETAPADVVLRLHEQGATGIVELSQGPIWKKLTLIDGAPADISSNVGMETIGEHLVRAKLVPALELDRAMRELGRGGETLVERLLRRELITPDALAVELGRNIEHRLSDVMKWREGRFEFAPSEPTPPPLMPKMDLRGYLDQYRRLPRPAASPEPAAPDEAGPAGARPSLADALRMAREVARGGGKGRVDTINSDDEG